MSFMRGVVENAIRNMSPEERQEALHSVTRQVVALMEEHERIDALTHIVRSLAEGLSSEQVHMALNRSFDTQ
jgi:uncharacterized protein YaaW (UPF0174 family)